MRSIVALFVAVFILVQASPAFASTVGILSGTVVDASSHAPLANVKVTAAAPSGHYNATTDSHGFYSIAGVYADTYVVSFQLTGYQPTSLSGETVFADQTLTLNMQLEKELRTIATAHARSAGGAFQPNQTVDTYNVTSKQITTIQGNAANFNEGTIITSLPGGSFDSSGYPVIRGGRENEENFEFEGIPFTDAFTNQFTNSLSSPGLALQSAQLTPGLGGASQDNYGTGTFNLVAKRGSYPGYATIMPSIGGPAFRHGLNFEYGTASPDGRWSNYITLATDDIGRAYGGGLGTNCLTIGTCFSRYYNFDREFVDNLVFKFGKNNNQQLQLFYDNGMHNFRYGWGGFDNFNGLCFKTCDPFFLQFAAAVSGLKYLPLNNTTCPSPQACQFTSDELLLANLLPLEKGQTSTFQTLGSAGRPPYQYIQPNEAMKLSYNWSINSSTLLQAMAFKLNNVSTFDFPLAGGYSSTGAAHVDQQGGITNGFKLDLTKQLSAQHLLKVGGMFRYLHPVFDQQSNNYGLFNLVFSPNFELPDFIPDAQCPTAYGGPGSGVCGYLYGNNPAGISIPAGTKIPTAYESTVTNRQDWVGYIEDTWAPNDKFKLDGGLRIDMANYRFPTPTMDLNTCTSLFLPQYQYDSNGNLLFVPANNPNVQTVLPDGTLGPKGMCPKATFNLPNNEKRPVVPEPVFSASYRLGLNDQVRVSWGRSVEFAPLALVDVTADPRAFYGPNNAFTKIPGYGFNCGVNADQKCVTYAEQLYWDNAQDWAGGVPLQPVRPTVFTNADFSWSHQFTKGILNGVAFKVTPYWRKAQDETALSSSPLIVNGQVVTNPITGAVLYGPTVASNKGKSQDTGVEMQITREAEYGFSGQLSMTYQNETSSVIPLSSSEDFFPAIPPSSLNLGNAYRVGFLSPFVTSFDFAYQTHSGWKINPQIQYDIGYPISPGLLATATVNGKDVNLPNTNASLGLTGAPGGTDQYIDPQNPGSFFNPNIAATRGVPATSAPGGKLSHPESFTNLTIEYNGAKRWTAGLQISNLFNQLYSGPVYNSRYQPVANGISGPLTGLSGTSYLFPQYGFTNYGPNRYGQSAYINTPNGIRSYYLYATIKL